MKRTKKNNINSESAKEVKLGESLTIWNAAKIKEFISLELNNSESIILNFDKSEEYDFSFIQLLFSALKSSEIQGKKITILNMRPELRNLIEESGFDHFNYPVFSSKKSEGILCQK